MVSTHIIQEGSDPKMECAIPLDDISHSTEDESLSDISALQSSPRRAKRKIIRFQASRMIHRDPVSNLEGDDHQKLLRRIKETTDSLTQKLYDLEENIRAHLAKAKARMDGSNANGAKISMRKVHKLRMKKENTVQILESLRVLEVDVEAQMWEGWKNSSSSLNCDKQSVSTRSVDGGTSMDLSERLDELLSTSEAPTVISSFPNDDELLSNLTTWGDSR